MGDTFVTATWETSSLNSPGLLCLVRVHNDWLDSGDSRLHKPFVPTHRVLAFRIVNPTIFRPSLRINMSSSVSIVFLAL